MYIFIALYNFVFHIDLCDHPTIKICNCSITTKKLPVLSPINSLSLTVFTFVASDAENVALQRNYIIKIMGQNLMLKTYLSQVHLRLLCFPQKCKYPGFSCEFSSRYSDALQSPVWESWGHDMVPGFPKRMRPNETTQRKTWS